MNLGEDRDSKNMLISPFWGAFLGLNWGLHTRQADCLPFEPRFQPFLLCFSWSEGCTLLRLAWIMTLLFMLPLSRDDGHLPLHPAIGWNGVVGTFCQGSTMFLEDLQHLLFYVDKGFLSVLWKCCPSAFGLPCCCGESSCKSFMPLFFSFGPHLRTSLCVWCYVSAQCV
jgi:hypothetical protein